MVKCCHHLLTLSDQITIVQVRPQRYLRSATKAPKNPGDRAPITAATTQASAPAPGRCQVGPALHRKGWANPEDVIEVLSDLFILRGIPGHIRSDNGPE